MTDRIVLAGMAFLARHGVNEREKVEHQRFEVDIELELDVHAAGDSDDLAQTVDYRGVYEAVRAIVEGPSFDLIEALGAAIARDVLAIDPRAEAVTVRVRKPDVDLGGPIEFAGVEIHRRRRPAKGACG
jgi:dihydroneopterin aldolase